MKSCAPASLAAVTIRSMGKLGSANAILSRIERLNSMLSCSTTTICRRSQAVAKGDVLESDLAADRRHRRAWRVEGRFGRRVENVTKPRDRQPRLMEVLP